MKFQDHTLVRSDSAQHGADPAERRVEMHNECTPFTRQLHVIMMPGDHCRYLRAGSEEEGR